MFWLQYSCFSPGLRVILTVARKNVLKKWTFLQIIALAAFKNQKYIIFYHISLFNPRMVYNYGKYNFNLLFIQILNIKYIFYFFSAKTFPN